jgi:hypothetical protein
MNILLFILILISFTTTVIIVIARGLSWHYFNKIIDDSTNNRIHDIKIYKMCRNIGFPFAKKDIAESDKLLKKIQDWRAQSIVDNSPEEVINNSESEDIYTSQILPTLRAQKIVQAQQMRNMQFAPQDKYAAMNAASLLNRHD